MKILLLQDVYKLGRAGDVKKVANGYGRNYLIPQGLAILATPGAMNQVERIRQQADIKRAALNQEMGGVAEQLVGMTLTFPTRASETGRLYGSINNRMIAQELSEKLGLEITHRQVDSQPLRVIGEHAVNIRLTVDLIPEISVIVHREGETAAQAIAEAAEMDEEIAMEEAPIEELYAEVEEVEEDVDEAVEAVEEAVEAVEEEVEAETEAEDAVEEIEETVEAEAVEEEAPVEEETEEESEE